MRVDQKVVRQRFSRAAQEYAELSSIQMNVAQDLLGTLKVSPGEHVLDVGSGTGSLLCEVARSFADIKAFGLDIAQGMIHTARRCHPGLTWVCADAAKMPFKAWSFDMVFSSSSYQWVDDLPVAFLEAKRILKKDGRFYVALFGSATLQEFFESLQAASLMNGRTEVFDMRRLPSENDVRQAVKGADFRHRGVMVEKRTVIFKDTWELLKWTKAIGANGLAPKFFLGKELLADLERHYAARYAVDGGLMATFEIIWVDARK